MKAVLPPLRLVGSRPAPAPRVPADARWKRRTLESWATDLDAPDDRVVAIALDELEAAATVWHVFDARQTMRRCAGSLRRLLDRDEPAGPAGREVLAGAYALVEELAVASYEDTMVDPDALVEAALALPAGPRRRAAAKRLTFLPWDAFGLR